MPRTPGAGGAARAARRRWPLWVWLAGIALAGWITARSDYVADLSAFLPSAPTPEQAVLLDQLRSGVGARLVLIGIEGGTPDARTAASAQWARTLRDSGRFDAVHNGDTAQNEAFGRFLFEHRYLLSPAVDAERFSAAGLRDAIDETVSLLGTPAGALLKPILLRDPTGETVRMAEALIPSQAPRSEAGVWVSRAAPRAVLVATTRAAGADLDGQQAALAFLDTSFADYRQRAGAAASGLRLSTSGAGKFAVESRAQIEREVQRLALAGGAIVVVLLWLTFGSLGALAIALLPVATGVLAGIAAVSLGFGAVHGITLGFGTTLIGEAVDYAIYYLIQARPRAGDPLGGRDGGRDGGRLDRPDGGRLGGWFGPRFGARSGGRSGVRFGIDTDADTDADATTSAGATRWIATNWPIVRLGLWTSLCGFGALLFSGFPGLVQLGVFSIVGLSAAALTTRWVFPIVAPHGARGGGLRRQLGSLTGALVAWLPRLRWPLLALTVAAAAVLALMPSPWRGSLSSLSPVSDAALRLNAELRADVGAAEGGALVAVAAPDEAGALAQAEAVGRRLDVLVAQGRLSGYESPARLLPSPATQAARRDAIPTATALRERLAEATVGGPLAAERLGAFVDDAQAARTQAPLTRAALDGTPLATAIDALLTPGTDGTPWRALLSLQAGRAVDGGVDLPALRAALADVPGAQVLDIGTELSSLYARYLGEARVQALLGALAVGVLLALHLRSGRRLLAIAQPLVAAVLLVMAALALGGVALGILHLVGFLLVVAIGSNYALFFDQLRRGRRDAALDGGLRAKADADAVDVVSDDNSNNDSDSDTLASLALANLTTVLSFALLAASSIPPLYAIGQVVAPGALLSLLLAAALMPVGRPVRYGKLDR